MYLYVQYNILCSVFTGNIGFETHKIRLMCRCVRSLQNVQHCKYDEGITLNWTRFQFKCIIMYIKASALYFYLQMIHSVVSRIITLFYTFINFSRLSRFQISQLVSFVTVFLFVKYFVIITSGVNGLNYNY